MNVCAQGLACCCWMSVDGHAMGTAGFCSYSNQPKDPVMQQCSIRKAMEENTVFSDEEGKENAQVPSMFSAELGGLISVT